MDGYGTGFASTTIWGVFLDILEADKIEDNQPFFQIEVGS